MKFPVEDRVRWLYVDFNAYFASVEQQMQPELRGKPIAIVPVDALTTCCIACSYEAKAFGIKTGTDIKEARRLCPELRIVLARQEIYASFHRQFLAVIKTCLPEVYVRSIDEVACRLDGAISHPSQAHALAQKVKSALAESVGPYLRCSIGIAPNELLAKMASEFQKPDGLHLITSEDIPGFLNTRCLRDIPGIGERIEARLHQRQITTMPQFLSLSASQMRAIWGSVEGERLWYWLHGYDFDLPATSQSTIGHQHVLPPSLRTTELAGAVARKLLCRTAHRLRGQNLWARGLSVYLSFTPGREKKIWECHTRIAEAQDDLVLLEILQRMWKECPPGRPTFVGVTLYDLVPDSQHTGWLFAEEEKRSRLRQSLEDEIGKLSSKIYPASIHGVRNVAPPQIAFGSIPDF